ncbi:hypothetical protein VPH35_105846 [Triticum aestivum]
MATVVGIVILLFLLEPFLAAVDVFCDNLKVVAASLPKNISSSPVHFATATFGQSPDVVYALALCRDDLLNDTASGECVTNTFKLTPPPPQRCYRTALYSVGAYFTVNPCVLAYSVDNILAPGNGDDMFLEFWTTKNVTGDVRLITGLIHELLVATVEKAASMELTRFAMGVVDSRTTFPLVYSLAQCTPDLSAGDCLACLRRLLRRINSTTSQFIGGQMYDIRCNFRYESFSFYGGEPMLHLGPSLAPAGAPTPTNKRRISKPWVIPIVVVPLAVATFLRFMFYSRWVKAHHVGSTVRRAQDMEGEKQLVWHGKNSEFSMYDYEQVQDATNNFSDGNKLGLGGFGTVYKGQFREGLEIAVKRLASHSGQGFIEFKNEVQLIAKLQHTNLVRLLGCCSQEDEKILIYEYLPNKSLDFFIFDENKRALLDWSQLVAIIEGVAHGLLYLHKHSQLRVIHRDLKTSNILLDSEMNPKISDFGLAKIFDSNKPEGNNTRRVVGTYGYMAPEYAAEGILSIKSDVFSFGVVVLEILSGKRNSGSKQCGDFINLLGYAWQLWEEERWIDLIHVSLVPESHSTKLMRCMNIALLCVQENVADRPTMPDIVGMLSSETMIITQPKQPAYFNVRVGNEEALTPLESCSINDMIVMSCVFYCPVKYS